MGLDLSKEGDKSRNPSDVYFAAFRFKGFWPTVYGENKTAADVDVLESGIIFAFAILAFSFYIILPGIRGAERFYAFVRITTSLFVGAVILLCNFGREWDIGSITTVTQYKAGPGNINATVGVKIGLRGVNITLKGDPEIQQLNELINYNEEFSWNPWREGRTGFGPYASAIRKDYREAQYRGTPYPILWVAEYFVQEGESMRWGFHYKQAGWFTHIMIWSAFALWLLANALYFVMPRYGAIVTIGMGVAMVIGNVLWVTIRSAVPLQIPLGNRVLGVQFGWCFYLNLTVGIVSILIGVALVLLDLCKPEALATFFSMDVLKDYEEFYADDTVVNGRSQYGTTQAGGHAELGRKTSGNLPGLRKRGFSIKRKISTTPEPLHNSEGERITRVVSVRRRGSMGMELINNGTGTLTSQTDELTATTNPAYESSLSLDAVDVHIPPLLLVNGSSDSPTNPGEESAHDGEQTMLSEQ